MLLECQLGSTCGYVCKDEFVPAVELRFVCNDEYVPAVVREMYHDDLDSMFCTHVDLKASARHRMLVQQTGKRALPCVARCNRVGTGLREYEASMKIEMGMAQVYEWVYL